MVPRELMKHCPGKKIKGSAARKRELLQNLWEVKLQNMEYNEHDHDNKGIMALGKPNTVQ